LNPTNILGAENRFTSSGVESRFISKHGILIAMDGCGKKLWRIHADQTVIGHHGAGVFLSLLGSDQDHSVICPGAVYGRTSGVLQYSDAFDVRRIQQIDVPPDYPVNHHERRIISQCADSPNVEIDTGSRLGAPLLDNKVG